MLRALQEQNACSTYFPLFCPSFSFHYWSFCIGSFATAFSHSSGAETVLWAGFGEGSSRKHWKGRILNLLEEEFPHHYEDRAQGGGRTEWTTARDNNSGLNLGPRVPSFPQHSLPTYHQHFLSLLLCSDTLKFIWLKKFVSWHHQEAANKWNVDFCNSFPDTAGHIINCDLEAFFHTGLVLHCMGWLEWTRASWTMWYPNSLETCYHLFLY